MKKLPASQVLALLSALTLAAGTARGQATAPSSGASNAKSDKNQNGAIPANALEENNEEDIITLDPFTVSTVTEGYRAEDTLGGARTRTNLADTPSSISVITPKLMQDLGVTNSESLLLYTTGTETSGIFGNYSGMTTRGAGVAGAAEGQRLANPQALNRARGIGAMDNTRNYLLSSIPWDGYNISRVEIARGPNSFLFGVGAPSGISNVMTNTANFKDAGSLEARYGSHGSVRGTFDYNKVLLKDQLAVRLDLVTDEAKFQQKPAFNHQKRVYGALRYEPKFLNNSWGRTKIQANFERGQVHSNNPRIIPPTDWVSGYLSDPRASKTGYNLWTYSPSSAGAGSTDLDASFYTSNGSYGNWNQWGSGPQFYWDAATGKLINAGQPNFNSPRGNGYGEATNRYHVQSSGLNNYAKNANGVYRQAHGGVDGGEFAGALSGSVNYFDKTMSDRSLFDFFNHLIDGENKRERQEWDTGTVNIVQSLFNNKLTLQGVYSYEHYNRGQEGLLSNTTIMLDLDRYLSTYPTWLNPQENPNFGRAMMVGPYSGGGRQWTERENVQLTGAYDFDFGDYFSRESLLTRIAGRHQFTGLFSRATATDHNLNYRLAGMSHTYASTWAGATRLSENSLNWLAYLSPSLLGGTGMSSKMASLGHTMPADTFQLAQLGGMTVFDRTWNAPSSVLPTDPWVMPGPDGTSVNRTQADNPANYRGYTRVPASVITSATHMDELRTGSSMNEQRIDSKAIMYQGHFWDGTIIPSFGYRQDRTLQRGNTSKQQTNGLYSEITEFNDVGISTTTTSTSYGVAIHLPKSIKKRLSEGTDLSFYYFHGANETPKVRYAVDGTQLPNEKGKTNDYSVQFDYRGRLTVRLTRFDTQSLANQASYGSPLGGSGWFIGAAPNWVLGMVVPSLAAFEMPDSALPQDTLNASWMYNWARQPERAELMPKIAKALKEDFTQVFDEAFFARYGSNVDVAAIKRGDWLHVLKDNTTTLPWTVTGIGDSIHGVQEIIDQDVQSKGYELEVTGRPLPNWDITFNVAKVNAQQTKLGDGLIRHLEGMKHIFVDTALGDAAMWGGYNDAGAWRSEFMRTLWAPYKVQTALLGSDQPEVREWRFNMISNYRFDRGPLRGLNFGGAYRWEDKSALGFGIHNADIGQGQTVWIADVNKPLYGPTEEHFDVWIGYENKLTKKVNWRLQLNVRNVGERTKLVPITLLPNGEVANSRIQSGQSIETSMRFSF